MEFYNAYQYLDGHPMFKGEFNKCLDIMVVKVNPETNEIDDIKELNTKTQIWLESGDEPHIHDTLLDCGGDTFEEAIINLAGLVKKHYGNIKVYEKKNNQEEINLYVDDLRDCPEDFIVARNAEEAISFLENFNVNVLSLDHDLGQDEKGNLLPTGYDLVKLFCERGFYCKKIYIHTDNGPGRENMYQTLKAAQRRGFISSNIEIYHYPITENKYSDVP